MRGHRGPLPPRVTLRGPAPVPTCAVHGPAGGAASRGRRRGRPGRRTRTSPRGRRGPGTTGLPRSGDPLGELHADDLDRLPEHVRRDARQVADREHLGPGEVVGQALVPSAGQHRRRDLRHVGEVDVREGCVERVRHGEPPGDGRVDEVLVVCRGAQHRDPGQVGAHDRLGLRLAEMVRHRGVVRVQHRVEDEAGQACSLGRAGDALGDPDLVRVHVGRQVVDAVDAGDGLVEPGPGLEVNDRDRPGPSGIRSLPGLGGAHGSAHVRPRARQARA